MTRRKAVLALDRKINGKAASFNFTVEGYPLFLAGMRPLLLEAEVCTCLPLFVALFEIFDGVEADHRVIERGTLRSSELSAAPRFVLSQIH